MQRWPEALASEQGEAAAARLRRDFPTIFGVRTMLAPITRNHINNFVKKADDDTEKSEPNAKRGRKSTLPQSVEKLIIETLSSVISSRWGYTRGYTSSTSSTSLWFQLSSLLNLFTIFQSLT